jgi:hypothetical protein
MFPVILAYAGIQSYNLVPTLDSRFRRNDNNLFQNSLIRIYFEIQNFKFKIISRISPLHHYTTF